MKVVVVIPTYNERENIKIHLTEHTPDDDQRLKNLQCNLYKVIIKLEDRIFYLDGNIDSDNFSHYMASLRTYLSLHQKIKL